LFLDPVEPTDKDRYIVKVNYLKNMELFMTAYSQLHEQNPGLDMEFENVRAEYAFQVKSTGRLVHIDQEEPQIVPVDQKRATKQK